MTANTVSKIVGFRGSIVWDKSRPNGTPRKLLDSSKFSNLGWESKIPLFEGINSTYNWYLNKKLAI